MKHHLLTLIATFGLMAVLAPSNAAAQAPPMDMSWAIRQQMTLQAQGDAYARATAMAYYNYMAQLRRAGYTGPSLPTGVTADTLRAANERLQNTMDRYHQSSANNSNRRSNAVADWNYRAIRGCQLVTDGRGYRYYVCP